MVDMPLVSVVMTTLNSARFIREAVESILAQTYKNWEMIIVDSGSTDKTITLLKKYMDSRIHIFECAGLKRSSQLNYAMKKVSGEYIAIMDSDDIALPQRLEKQLKYLQNNTFISLVGSWSQYIDENGGFLQINKRPIEHEQIIKRLFSFGHPSLSSVMFRKSILDSNQCFNESLQGLEDIEWYLRISSFARFGILPKVLMKFRQTKNSLSRKKNDVNKQIFINSVDTYYLKKMREERSSVHRAPWGIAHYYYGESGIARKLLFESLWSEGISFQTLRYLIPTIIFPGTILNVVRRKRFTMKVADCYRTLGNN